MLNKNFFTKTRWLVTIILLLSLGVSLVKADIAYGTYVEASAWEANAHYILTGVYSSTTYAAKNENNNSNRKTTSVTVNNNGSITVANNSTVCTFTLGGSNNAWTFCADNYIVNNTVTSNCYLRATSSTSNNLGLNSNTVDDNAKWTLGSFTNGVATMVANGTNTRKKVRFNPNNGTPLISAYATSTSTGSDVKFYRKAVQGASNNTNYGTVSVAGDVITATPASGYQISTSNPYTISPANSATVNQSTNTFTVTLPNSNPTVTTITINFEAAAPSTYTVVKTEPNGQLHLYSLFQYVKDLLPLLRRCAIG